MKADDEDRPTKLKDLKELLTNEFEQRHEQQALEINRTEERLDALKLTHQKRSDHKDQIVQRRMDQLTGKPDLLEWEPAVNPPRLASPSTPLRQPKRSAKFDSADSYRPQTAVPQTAVSQTVVPLPVVPLTAVPQTVAPATQWRPPTGATTSPAVPQASGRIEVTSAASTDVFDLARRISTATMQLALADEELQRFRSLRSKNAIPESQLKAAESKRLLALRELGFAKAQWESLSARLKRNVDYAEGRLARSMEQFRSVEYAVKNGTEPRHALLAVQETIDRAKQDVDEAREKINELELANKMIADVQKYHQDHESSDSDKTDATDDNADADDNVDADGNADEDAASHNLGPAQGQFPGDGG
jgi:hypothetical protein